MVVFSAPIYAVWCRNSRHRKSDRSISGRSPQSPWQIVKAFIMFATLFLFCHLGNRKGCTRCQNLPQLGAVTYCPSEVAPLRCEWQGLYFNF